MAYLLFLLVNAALFIRPAEVVPALLGWRIYEALIITCFVLALPEVLAFFGRQPLDGQPVTLCVFGLLPAVLLSHLSHLEFERAAASGFEFAKVVVYYVLLVSLVNTPGRLRIFLLWVGIFSAAVTLLAVLRYHDVVEIELPEPTLPAIQAEGHQSERGTAAFVEDRVRDPETGEMVVLKRLRGTGIFKDPNDLCLVLIGGIPLGLYWLTERRAGALRLFWLGPLALFFYALYLTQSRGGFLGLLGGLAALLVTRFGWRRSLALAVLVLPLLFVAFAGRMTTLETASGTGQTRIQIWSDALMALRSAPLFGIGMDQFAQEVSRVAHNSFLHCYTELGLVGGTLFLGAFYFALLTLGRLGSGRGWVRNPEMRRLRPYLLALVASAAVCMLSLSLTYIVPTYMILGLATAYAAVTVGRLPVPVLRFDVGLAQRLALASIGFLAAVYVFVRVFRA
jgi:hypothetical protein